MQKKQLKKLQALWAKKLERSGFFDIERANGTLKNHDAYRVREMNANHDVMAARQRYYELARQFYHANTFETSREKRVWHMHSEGESTYTIAGETKSSQSDIDRIVRRLAKKMLAQRVGKLDD